MVIFTNVSFDEGCVAILFGFFFNPLLFFPTLKSVLMYSILIPFQYQVVSVERTTWMDVLSWRHIANNYLMAYLTSLCLECGSTGIGMGISAVTGIETMDLNVSPLTTSKSPSDFW